MVFIESKKYACETCIKGHRSSACKHTDRPLFEIKKKGRPVTQCEHCRELRKTKQVHVKCICELKTDTSLNKAGSKAHESAAFPNGLPDALALEASVARLETRAPDSLLHGGVTQNCSCVTSGICNCCTPRKSAPRPRRKTESALSSTVAAGSAATGGHAHPDAQDAGEATPPRASSHIIARISELRPVLPRPSALTAPHHDPSSGVAHGHANRHHESTFFSPYGRAYDINHLHYPHTTDEAHQYSFNPSSNSQSADHVAANTIPNSSTNPSQSSITFPSPCGCGDGCSCPGCSHHNNASSAPSPTAYPTCSNPTSCNACLDCTILSILPDTALSIPEPQQADAIDEWIRQVQANPNSLAMSNMDGQFGSWESFSQLTAATGRRHCATCSSPSFCSCDKEGSDNGSSNDYRSTKSPCCDKPPISNKPIDVGSFMPPAQGQQGYSSSDIFDYSVFGMPSSNDAYLDTTPNVIESFRSRSPSISPNSAHEFPQLFTTLPYSTYIDKMPPAQQSVFINGRGFYSDPYLSLGSNERVDGFSLRAHTPFLGLPLSSVDLPAGSYAVSNPDSEASSFDSLDDLALPPTAPQSNKSVSPASFERMQPLY